MSRRNRNNEISRAGIILENSAGEVLIVQTLRRHKWGFPKGQIEPGEPPLVAAHRELKEETGVELDPADEQVGELFDEDGHYFVYRTSQRYELDQDVIDSSEIEGTRWVSKHNLRNVQRPNRMLRNYTNYYTRYDWTRVRETPVTAVKPDEDGWTTVTR